MPRSASAPGGTLVRLFQKGSAKAMLPRTHGPPPKRCFSTLPADSPAATGWLTRSPSHPNQHHRDDADRRKGLCVHLGAAGIDVTLRIGAGARLDWLPQETILFDRSALHRTTRIELGEGASCLFAEMLTLGRSAMGETVRTLDLVDRRIVTREGAPVLVEPLRLATTDLSRRDAAGLAGATALVHHRVRGARGRRPSSRPPPRLSRAGRLGLGRQARHPRDIGEPSRPPPQGRGRSRTPPGGRASPGLAILKETGKTP